jgi:FLVCR family feline leukemia virus subgroup C receptor-related protein
LGEATTEGLDENNVNYGASIKRLMTNRGYVLLLITYGLNVGVFYAIATLLNTVVLTHFKDAESDAGRIGLIIVICGMVGSMLCGLILDKTHAYKTTTLLVYLFSFVGMVIYTLTVRCGYIYVVYCTAGLLGFFMTGYLPLGFEFAAEITFPESEGTSSGLLNASAQVFGIICTMAGERLLGYSGDDRVANGMLALVLLLGTILTGCIKPDYRRQAAASSH